MLTKADRRVGGEVGASIFDAVFDFAQQGDNKAVTNIALIFSCAVLLASRRFWHAKASEARASSHATMR
jgi:hypothetical protein